MFLYIYIYKMQSCLICLEESNNLNAITHCGVYYVHSKCYSQWLIKNNTCIVCRKSLTQEPNNTSEVTSEETRLTSIKFIIANIIISTSLLTLTILTLYIFVTCDLKKTHCKLF
jgi:hypothetical protein